MDYLPCQIKDDSVRRKRGHLPQTWEWKAGQAGRAGRVAGRLCLYAHDMSVSGGSGASYLLQAGGRGRLQIAEKAVLKKVGAEELIPMFDGLPRHVAAY